MAINLGSKYYKNIDDGRIVVRVLNYHDDTKTTKIINLSTKETEIIKASILNDQYIELVPDMKLDVMITEDEDGTKDVYAWVYRSDYIVAGLVKAITMLRANCYSYFKNLTAQGNDIWVGDCINSIDNPDQRALLDLAEFKKIVESQHYSLYVTDGINDIIQCINKKFKGRIDSVLNEMSNKFAKQPNVKGYSRTLEELMRKNNFIDEVRMSFNIYKIEWNIILDEDSYNANGDIILNEKQTNALEDMLRKEIADVKIIPYDKDVDISKIVQYEHIMVSDQTNQIYLIAYRKIADYKPDNDIARGMGLV